MLLTRTTTTTWTGFVVHIRFLFSCCGILELAGQIVKYIDLLGSKQKISQDPGKPKESQKKPWKPPGKPQENPENPNKSRKPRKTQETQKNQETQNHRKPQDTQD